MPSSVSAHTIPSFYACYFLRSYAGKSKTFSKTYIGSTPDPKRRKRQHNGELTAGARKTSRGRPWEMEMIVYGFPSKIAALQFEWAWQSPHLTRHLRVLPSEAELPGVTQTAGETLLPQTISKRTRKGKTIKVSLKDPRSKFIALRALLASEPFSLWGLRVVFFAEWAWETWKTLEESGEGSSSSGATRFQFGKVSRAGVRLPPYEISPAPVCAWKGVDASRKALSDVLFTERGQDAPGQEGKKVKSKTTRDVYPDPEAGLVWNEPNLTLKNALNDKVKLQWDDLDGAPIEQHAATAGKSAGQEWFDCSDNKLTDYQWKRFETLLQNQGIFEVESLVEKPKTLKCSSCGDPIDLTDHTSYSLCATSYRPLMPSPSRPARSSDQDSFCSSVYHVHCLADAFAADSDIVDDSPLSKQTEPTLLPVAGRCPGCGPSAPLSSWTDVIRGVFRRKDRYDEVLVSVAKGNALKEKRRQKEAERQAALEEKRIRKEEAKRLRDEERAQKAAISKQSRTRKKDHLSDSSSDDLATAVEPRKTTKKVAAPNGRITGYMLADRLKPHEPGRHVAIGKPGKIAAEEVIDLISPDVSTDAPK